MMQSPFMNEAAWVYGDPNPGSVSPAVWVSATVASIRGRLDLVLSPLLLGRRLTLWVRTGGSLSNVEYSAAEKNKDEKIFLKRGAKRHKAVLPLCDLNTLFINGLLWTQHLDPFCFESIREEGNKLTCYRVWSVNRASSKMDECWNTKVNVCSPQILVSFNVV